MKTDYLEGIEVYLHQIRVKIRKQIIWRAARIKEQTKKECESARRSIGQLTRRKIKKEGGDRNEKKRQRQRRRRQEVLTTTL